MDISKFLSLLDRAALYFPRVDKLSAADPFEGYYTRINAEFAKLTFDSASVEMRERLKITDEKSFDMYMEGFRIASPLAKAMREVSYVSSWHVLEHESAAMWALYLRSEDGIAVQSTYQGLVDLLLKVHGLRHFRWSNAVYRL